MIDLHCHLLPGIDDGPEHPDDALAMARAHVDAGVEVVAATPHVMPGLPTRAARIADAVAELRTALAERDIALEVVSGAEVDLGEAVALPDDELERLALGGGPWLLVESPLRPHPHPERALCELLARGHRIVLAHPERSRTFLGDAALLRRLVRRGVLTQVTADSLVGRFGATPRRYARWMADEGLLHTVASDAHDPEHRAPGLRAQLEEAGLGDRGAWLTEEMPLAILDGSEPPEPPAPGGRAGGGRLLRRVRVGDWGRG